MTFATSAHMGTWKLNESKSKMMAGESKLNTVVYAETKSDKMKVSVQGVDKDGKPVAWTWVGKFDGKQEKTKGSTITDSIAFTVKNDRTNEMTVMKDGKVIMTGTITVSKDGKTRVVTSHTTGADGKKHTNKAYYDKQ